MGYTLEQLEAMGATPVGNSAPSAPSPVSSPSAPKKKYTFEELQAQGAKPVSTPAPVAPAEQPKKDWLSTAAGITDAIFGAGKIGEYIGTKYAEAKATPEERAAVAEFGSDTFKTPSKGEMLGSAAQAAVNFLPVGRIASGLTKVANKVVPFVGSKAAKFAGNVGAGAATGYGYDVSTNFAQDKEDKFTPGIGTLTGGTIPFVPPVFKAAGKVASEGLGVSTGVGQGAIKRGAQATAAGGEEAKAFRDAMRGNVSPENIVEEARGALGQIIKDRTDSYRKQLGELKTNVKEFKTDSIVEKYNRMLDDYGVTFTEDGLPDFSRSPGLGRYEKDLMNISKVLQNWGTREGDNTVVGIDKLKQVIDDFRIGSADSRKFDAFVTALRNEAKTIVKNEPGYNKLVGDWENSTGLIKEIQRGLSLGDKAQTDTAFRKLTGVLRTNNEFRKSLADELDALTKGTLTAKVAGQQMSELMPRGLSRIVTPALGVGGAFGGVGIVPLLQAALFTSPRIVGEILSALGYGASKIKQIMQIIAPKGFQFPGDMLLDTAQGQKLEKSLIASAKNPSMGLSTRVSSGLSNPEKDVLLKKLQGLDSQAAVVNGQVDLEISDTIDRLKDAAEKKGGLTEMEFAELNSLLKGKGIGKVDDILRPGQRPIGADVMMRDGEFVPMNEVVARERFNVPALKKISFGGSDRDVYDLGDNVLKVSKSPRGLSQNISDYYAEDSGLIPRTIEQGKNYIVKEKVLPPDANTKKMIAELKKLNTVYLVGKTGGYDSHRAEVDKAIEIFERYGYNGSELLNYDPLWGDFVVVRNWGTTKEGKPIMLDEGSLDGNLILNDIRRTNEKGKGNLSDPEFRDIYHQSRNAKKKFGDVDKKTMYGLAAPLALTSIASASRSNQE